MSLGRKLDSPTTSGITHCFYLVFSFYSVMGHISLGLSARGVTMGFAQTSLSPAHPSGFEAVGFESSRSAWLLRHHWQVAGVATPPRTATTTPSPPLTAVGPCAAPLHVARVHQPWAATAERLAADTARYLCRMVSRHRRRTAMPPNYASSGAASLALQRPTRCVEGTASYGAAPEVLCCLLVVVPYAVSA